jgi:hypothetical protein
MTPASRAAGVVATKAIDLPVPTFEASVSCGSYCQGGTVSFEATTYPEYTDLWEVWVKGTDVATLASSHADLLAALEGLGPLLEECDCIHSDSDDPAVCPCAMRRAALSKAKGGE